MRCRATWAAASTAATCTPTPPAVVGGHARITPPIFKKDVFLNIGARLSLWLSHAWEPLVWLCVGSSPLL